MTRSVVLLATVGCAAVHAPNLVPRQDLQPSGLPAEVYNAPLQPGSPSERWHADILAEISRLAAHGAPVWDARLHAAATDLARVVPENEMLSYGTVAFALQHHGLIEPTPRMLAIWADEGDEVAALAWLSERLAASLANGAYRRVGIGSARRGGGRVATVVAMQKSFLETQPIPKVVRARGTFHVRGRLLPPFRRPEVLVTHSDGTIERPRTHRMDGQWFVTVISCRGGPGREQVEINGTYAGGGTVLANFPVFCGEEPPWRASVELMGVRGTPACDESALEAELLTRINDERVAVGLASLEADRGVAGVARAYAAEMARTEEVAHVVAGTSARGRLERAGFSYPVVLENLSRTGSVDEAHQGLMASPGHRRNIIAPNVTHAGIGVACADGDLLVTQLFVRPPAAMAETLRNGQKRRRRIRR